MKKISSLILIIMFSLTSCGEVKLSKLEKKYIDELHQWIKSGGNQNTVRSVVQANCSKLTMVMATKEENVSFLDKSNIDEYDFRAGFCMSAVIESVWPNRRLWAGSKQVHEGRRVDLDAPWTKVWSADKAVIVSTRLAVNCGNSAMTGVRRCSCRPSLSLQS